MIFVHTLGTASIDVGSCSITPTSPRKFALLLYLAAERGRRIPRSVLQELIFPDQAERNARHSLRELIYQLRQVGVEIDPRPDALELITAVRLDYDAALDDRAIDPELLNAVSGGFMPGYAPTHSEAYVDWYEAYRARSVSVLSRALLKEVDRARNGGEWTRTETAARACLALDPLNEQATFVLAEMLFLGGSKAGATRLLDRYTEEVGRIYPELSESAQTLRRRISQAQERATGRFAPRFVGRTEEMDALRRSVQQTRAGNSQCVVVSGEPGIGKSRLVSELCSIVQLEGFRCETVAMHPHDAYRPMGAFVDLVPMLLRLPGALGCAPESMEALRRLTRATIPVAVERPEQIDLDAIAFGVTAAIVDVCESIADEGPLALIIEDAHSVDSYSLNALSALLSCGRQARVLIIITTREARRLRPKLCHAGKVTWIPLRPLSQDAMSALIDDIVSPPLSPEARLRLVETANGNPLFALSLATHCRQSDNTCGTPSTLFELLAKRIDPVSNIGLGVLATCIALGKHCTTDRMLRAIEVTPIALLDALAELAELGLVDAHSDHATPVHPLIAEVVGERLLPAVRSVVNFRVAEVFENDARSLGSPAYWWEAGNRWRDAGEPDRALAAFRECARHAMEIGQAADAARILNEALSLPASERATLDAARELIKAADLSSDTGLVLRGHMVLTSAGIADQHDDFELAARRAVVRDSYLPDRIFEMTLGCLRATKCSAEHRILAATIGLKYIHVAQGSSRVARMIEEQVSPSDLEVVEDVVRLEFELLVYAATDNWEGAARTAEELMRAAEGKRPGRQATIQQNCGIALTLAGKPHAAIDAFQRAFHGACLAQSPSQQVRLACLVAGVYADLLDDENWDAWLSRAIEADSRASVLIEVFDIPVMQICRSFARRRISETQELLSRENKQRHFSGSPIRERWGKVFSLLAEVRSAPTSAEHERAARELIDASTGGISGVRDFEIATAATILAVRDRNAALKAIRDYLASERRGRQLIDRQLTETIRELEPTSKGTTLPLFALTLPDLQSESFGVATLADAPQSRRHSGT